MLYEKNEFKISSTTWNDRFELPGRSYCVSDIQVILSISSKTMEKRLMIL